MITDAEMWDHFPPESHWDPPISFYFHGEVDDTPKWKWDIHSELVFPGISPLPNLMIFLSVVYVVYIYIYLTIQTCGKLRYQTHVTCRKLIFFSKRSFKAIKSWIFSVDQPVVQVARCPSCTRKFRSL